jgi:hypothetical protein
MNLFYYIAELLDEIKSEDDDSSSNPDNDGDDDGGADEDPEDDTKEVPEGDAPQEQEPQ